MLLRAAVPAPLVRVEASPQNKQKRWGTLFGVAACWRWYWCRWYLLPPAVPGWRQRSHPSPIAFGQQLGMSSNKPPLLWELASRWVHKAPGEQIGSTRKDIVHRVDQDLESVSLCSVQQYVPTMSALPAWPPCQPYCRSEVLTLLRKLPLGLTFSTLFRWPYCSKVLRCSWALASSVVTVPNRMLCSLASPHLTASWARHFHGVSGVLVEQNYPGSFDHELLHQTAEWKLQLSDVPIKCNCCWDSAAGPTTCAESCLSFFHRWCRCVDIAWQLFKKDVKIFHQTF